MRVIFTECDGCFSVNLYADTLEDAVKLARFGRNKTKEIRSQGAAFNSNGTADGHIVIGKRKDSNNYI